MMAQATAFGLKSVVGVPGLEMDQVGALSSFCAKASTVSNGEASLFMSTMKVESAIGMTKNQSYGVKVLFLLFGCYDLSRKQ